ncbi:MAG: hypothetical protein KAG70_00470, partial [Alcanivorax sp.]|nr:hypothetical protein [Alcanivorax sp.]
MELEIQRKMKSHEEDLDGAQAELERLEQALSDEKSQRLQAQTLASRAEATAQAQELLASNSNARADRLENELIKSVATLNARN